VDFHAKAHVPGPMGEYFSGSCAVTSRNTLPHKGATNGTNSPRFDTEGVALCCCRVLAAAPEGLLATANFGEFIFLRPPVNKCKNKGRGCFEPRPD
jgi:hypothetical protein